MSVYDFAMQMEQDGKAYYNELKGKTENPAIQKIFEMLAQDEQDHYDAIRRNMTTLPPSKTLEHAQNIFEEITENAETIYFEISEDALRHALDIEYKSIKFYEEQNDKADHPDEKSLFAQLVSEESKHYILIENLLDIVSGGILRGIESAEFPPLPY